MADDAKIQRGATFAINPSDLRDCTPARVGLERAGSSLATRHALEFALAHAQARDAVHSALDVVVLLSALGERRLPAVAVCSAAAGRTEYLRRPDLGRRLSQESAEQLSARMEFAGHGAGMEKYPGHGPARIAFILADGLSALATQRHAIPLVDALLPLLDQSWRMTPVVVAEQARVALGDEIGSLLRADVTVMLIGERPGLSSPDSLGAYITWNPQLGRTDAERNCVSNIRTGGLDSVTAAQKIAWYAREGRRLGLSGVALRESDAALLP
jgi:ethanolamine ammonia-lyase small subunit